MAGIADVKKEIAKAETTSLQSLIQKSAKELGKALPDHMRPERLVRIALTCVRLNPELGRCTPESFLGALFVSAQLGLEPVAGRAYILPFNNSRKDGNQWITVKEAQFVMGFKGLVDLFFRHDKSVGLNWAVVKKNDEFDYELGTKAFLRHKPAKVDRGPAVGYWVMGEISGGGKPFLYMSADECLEHGRKHSKTFDKKANNGKGDFYAKSPWRTDPDSMSLKTVLIQVGKVLPLSLELQRALTADETSREFRSGVEDALDLPTTNNWEPEPAATSAPAGDAIEPA